MKKQGLQMMLSLPCPLQQGNVLVTWSRLNPTESIESSTKLKKMWVGFLVQGWCQWKTRGLIGIYSRWPKWDRGKKRCWKVTVRESSMRGRKWWIIMERLGKMCLWLFVVTLKGFGDDEQRADRLQGGGWLGKIGSDVASSAQLRYAGGDCRGRILNVGSMMRGVVDEFACKPLASVWMHAYVVGMGLGLIWMLECEQVWNSGFHDPLQSNLCICHGILHLC